MIPQQPIRQRMWKPAPGYEGLYEVSRDGRVRSLDRRVPHAQNKGRNLKGKEKAPMLFPNGYIAYQLCRHGKIKSCLAHRLVCIAFNGPPPDEKPHVNHIDGDKANNVPENLEWVSPSENLKHAHHVLGVKWTAEQKARREIARIKNLKAGLPSGQCKLTLGGVMEIRRLLKRGETTVSIARRFNVSRRTIANIRNGKT